MRNTATTKPDALRSRTMRAVKSKDTAPELRVRRLVHAMGYRYRLHRKDLPGHPDLVFPGRRKAIFIHGCFWHGHDCRRGARMPKTNADYWTAKIGRNRERDARTLAELAKLGWGVCVLWECELKDEAALRRTLRAFLDG
ncbi:MAG TPA: very short patch repair endonuclease [Asticcacaulis sp.]